MGPLKLARYNLNKVKNIFICDALNYVLQNSYVETLAPSVTVFEDMYYKEMVKLKWGQKGRPWDDRVSDLLRRDPRELALTLWEYSKNENTEKETICKSGKGLLPEFNYAGTLWRRLSTEELMLLNCGIGEDSWESHGLQGDPTSLF